MSKNLLIGIGIVAGLVIVGTAAYILRPPAEASEPIEAVAVEVEATTEPIIATETDDQISAEASEDMSMAEEDAVAPVSDGVIVFSIVQAESEVRFTLGELLSGVPTTVIGTTDQVAGEIAIDPANPADSRVGVIQVNARTFATDSNFRNRAINNSILETGKFEYVTFTPAEIANFPENPSIGEALEFQISGDLTVRDITNPVTFDVVVTAVSENRLEGSASATIARVDYGLQIPEVPRVADVDEEVLLEIKFVALEN